ncbi:OLC1v1006080C1 [Oldenlandia corymbosa var. corymbosa]|uniref:OLC1v1006080C1 n=1 Tax=Oldenlandia corymbosa var. corymbosa TaxID=529605 RepID=A0AAV1DJ57_OLDCO|nr:OLC1v1006080C1 [Oldenlandia corymbosa var. corymbosa]
MAPAALSSNSFFLNFKTPHQRVAVKRSSRLTVFAKKSGPFPGFGLGKSADDDSGEDSGNSSPFFKFDFGKLPDVNSLVPALSGQSSGFSLGRVKDSGTVFVAGATGQVGVRIAQALLREGFKVRAGVNDLAAAQELALLAATYKIISTDESKRLNAVQSNFKDAESIAKAIGNATKVVVTIGPKEDGPAAEVTTNDALQVIEAAQLAKVGHVAVVYDDSSFSTSTYNVLDGITSFFGNLFSKSPPLTIPEFLEKLVETDLSYTLIKTNLTEDYLPESSYNLVVSAEGTSGSTDYKVSKSQIASLVAGVFSNTAVAENKVVEVSSDPEAKSKSIEELFSTIPEDGRRKAYAEALEKAKQEEEAIRATEEAREAAAALKKRESELKKTEKEESETPDLAKEAQGSAVAAGASVESLLNRAKGFSSGISWQKLSSQLKTEKEESETPDLAKEAQESAATAGASVESLLNRAKDFSSGISWEKLSSQLKTAAKEASGEESKVQVATVRGQAKARSLPSQKAVVKKPTPPKSRPTAKPAAKPAAKPPPKQTESNREVRKVFGGLFKQETIYIDDD